MPLIKIIRSGKENTVSFDGEKLLSDILRENGFYISHPCGCKGTCKKCEVELDGKTVLSCRHKVSGGETVRLPDEQEPQMFSFENSRICADNVCLCLDIGSTTLAMALVSLPDGKILTQITEENPQRAYGADVISRIDYCMKNGAHELRRALLKTLNEMVNFLLVNYNIPADLRMYVSANTTMLHIFAGVDPSPMGRAPYTPDFLGDVKLSGTQTRLKNISEAFLLPGISAFVGADILSGISYVGLPENNKYRILIDLGTNAEIALFSKDKIICTAAAAGPCFEGANISCGMNARHGAIYSLDANGHCKVLGNCTAKGICGTGLIDAVAYGVRADLIDEDGYLDDDRLQLCDGVKLTQRDIRELQLAKSAIRAATECLIKHAGIAYDDVETVYVSGGFSESLNVANAAFIGLIPVEFVKNIKAVNNSSLFGTIKYALTDSSDVLSVPAEYIDLSRDAEFSQLFVEYMTFE